MSILIKNIKRLLVVQEGNSTPLRGSALSELNSIDNAFVYIKDGVIEDYGVMSEMPLLSDNQEVEVIDADGRMVMPAYCDSHTHIVYSGSREMEYMDKIRGLSYQEIAARGGGILNSVDLLHNTSEDELYRQAMERVDEMIRFGTGAIEVKSGYGLSVEDEVKMLRVARRIGDSSDVTVRTTFLGAHAYPRRYLENKSKYVDEIIKEMIPVIQGEGLADYIDVFCEQGFFSVEDSERILRAGIDAGMIPTIHANQMSKSGGVELGVKLGASSVCHLEFTDESHYKLLGESETIATMLPGSTFFLKMNYPNVREMIDKNVAVALATNYNPGSSPSGDMKFMMALSCLYLNMKPEEVINASTINGAYAMGVAHKLGSITKGKVANLIITKPIPTYEFIPYSFSTPLVEKTILKGKIYG